MKKKEVTTGDVAGGVIVVILIAAVVVWGVWFAFREPVAYKHYSENNYPRKCDICGEELSWDKVTVQLDYHLYRFCPKCYKANKIGSSIQWNIEWARKDLEKRINKKSRPYKAEVIKKLIDEF